MLHWNLVVSRAKNWVRVRGLTINDTIITSYGHGDTNPPHKKQHTNGLTTSAPSWLISRRHNVIYIHWNVITYIYNDKILRQTLNFERGVTRSFDVFFDLHLNKRLSKQSSAWWFETPSGSLWRHYNETHGLVEIVVWWRHAMDTLSAFLVKFEGNPSVTCGLPSQGTSYAELWAFFCCKPGQAIKQTIEFWWFERS